jgi:beta-mannosidase
MPSGFDISRRRFLESCAVLAGGDELLRGRSAVLNRSEPAEFLPAGQEAAPGSASKRASLDGVWDFQPIARTTLTADGSILADTSGLPPAGKMSLPANWHLHGLANFNGRVRFERTFDFEGGLAPSERVFILFHGVDYFAEVELNGRQVGRHEGYFQAFEFDITSHVKPGLNHIAVTLDAPKEQVGTVWPDHKRLIKGIFSHWDCKPGGVSKEFGQDGTSAGIWNSIELDVRNLAWLKDIKIQPFLYERSLATGNVADHGLDAKVFITATFHSVQPGRYQITATAGGSSVRSRLQLTTDSMATVLVLPIENPRLWWTWDVGDPHLYTGQLEISDSGGRVVWRREIRFGVRSISLDERSGEWRLNGKRFFIRGTNIVPEMWLARYTPQRIAGDIALLKRAHVNGVRVCVHVNRQELYDALDEAGIVAWQDFPLQWDYIHNNDFLEEAARQLREMVVQFYNHPSIITWVCQNESTSYNVHVMDPFLAQVGKQEDSSRPVRPVAGFNEHLYEGWYSGDYHDYASLPGGPIISELGAQALASLEEMGEMIGKSWPPDWKKLAYHDFQYDETFHVARISMGQDWTDFVQDSQSYQAALLKFTIEHYRRAKYRKVGCFFQFMFMDCWPAVTWSILSYERRPKLGYLALERAYQPVLIGADLDRVVLSLGENPSGEATGIRVSPWVVNDKHEDIDAVTCEISLVGMGSEFLLVRGPAVNLPQDSVIDLAALDCAPPHGASPGAYELRLKLRQEGTLLSSNSYKVIVVR